MRPSRAIPGTGCQGTRASSASTASGPNRPGSGRARPRGSAGARPQCCSANVARSIETSDASPWPPAGEGGGHGQARGWGVGHCEASAPPSAPPSCSPVYRVAGAAVGRALGRTVGSAVVLARNDRLAGAAVGRSLGAAARRRRPPRRRARPADPGRRHRVGRALRGAEHAVAVGQRLDGAVAHGSPPSSRAPPGGGAEPHSSSPTDRAGALRPGQVPVRRGMPLAGRATARGDGDGIPGAATMAAWPSTSSCPRCATSSRATSPSTCCRTPCSTPSRRG